MIDYSDSFREAIQAKGMTPPVCIRPGVKHRFPGVGKKSSNEAGWCFLFPDGRGGIFGDYSSGLYEVWQANRDQPMTQQERVAFRRKIAQAKREAEKVRQDNQAAAARRAFKIWEAAKPAKEDHPYLIKKRMKPSGLRQNEDGRLVAPLWDAEGMLHSIQFINEDGEKRFLRNGRIEACHFFIGDKPKPGDNICIAEGIATAASIHAATGFPVAVAFNAGNLKAVAEALREQHPDAKIVICADDDYRTPGNPGITKATEAARAVGGWLAVPDFDQDRQEVAV